jgi:hypothetical protein
MTDVFIILPGPYLNNLTKEEKEYIKTRPTIATGHYLLYWETIGIIPDVYIHVGHAWDHPTNCIVPGGLFYGASVICKHHDLDTKFYVQPETKLYLDGGPIPKSDAHPGLGKSLKPCPENHGIESTAIDITEHPSHQGASIWAESITGRFWFNSGVGTAINLATVLHPECDIKLIGNDGGTAGGYFYNSEKCDKSLITVMGKELTSWAKPSPKSQTLHYNMNHYNAPHAVKMVEQRGGRLFNCNRESYFTQGAEKYIDMDISNLNTKNLFSIPHANVI